MRVKNVCKNSAINVYLGDKLISSKKESTFLPAEIANIEIKKEDLEKNLEKELVVKIEPT